MRRLNPHWIRLGVCLCLAGLLGLAGCSSPTGQATEAEVTNRAFAFADGAVFHAALAGKPTTLFFLDNATTFMLLSADGSGNAAGSHRFGSCELTVTSSTYASGDGPQMNDVITLNPCEFDSENSTLTVSNRGITITSATAVARVVDATASDVRNRAFLFDSGEVFHVDLLNVATTLSFNSNGSEFTLSAGAGTASGVVQFSPCVLTVRSSNYRAGTGPDVGTVISLSACRFNGGNRSMIISNGMVSVLSI